MGFMKTEKLRKIIAITLGVAILISGIVILCMSSSHTGSTGGVSRASTDIKFGADYYTTSARYIGLAANAASDIFDLIKLCFGLMFLFTGAFMTYHFGFDLYYIISDEMEREEHLAIKETLEEPFDEELYEE